MLIQKNYKQPYIASVPAELPYVGGELASLTSMTPFYRGQGIPIPAYQGPQGIHRPVNMGALNYGAVLIGLKKGSTGSDVTDLQNALRNKGYSIGNDAEGTFGSGTESALKLFQGSKNLAKTGVVDEKTKKKLDGGGSGNFWDTVANVTQQGVNQYLDKQNQPAQTQVVTVPAEGMGTGTKVAIAAGAVFMLGTFIYIATKV